MKTRKEKGKIHALIKIDIKTVHKVKEENLRTRREKTQQREPELF